MKADVDSDEEIRMNDDDLIGIETSNIIPRARRQAAKVAMEITMKSSTVESAAGASSRANDADDDSDDSEEAEF